LSQTIEQALSIVASHSCTSC